MKSLYCSFLLYACVIRTLAAGDVRTVEQVDLAKYLGTWNELYRVPNSFQDNTSSTKSACFATTAEYGTIEGGRISVTNSCRRKLDGQIQFEVAKAIATVVAQSGGAKLVVNFTGIGLLRWLGIGDGDYWILGLGPVNGDKKYSWALVGSPTRKYGWILARESTLSEAELKKVFDIAESNGYSRSQFIDMTRISHEK